MATTSKKVKKGPGRPKGSKNKTSTETKSKSQAKKTSSSKGSSTSQTKKPQGNKSNGKRTYTRDFNINPETGFVTGSNSDKVASELLKGGKSRDEINERVEKKIGTTNSKGGNRKGSQIVGTVYHQMLRRGYRVEQSFKMLPPTPASKRAATQRAKKQASK